MIPISRQTVFVCGHRGMVGAAICRRLAREGATIVTVDRNQVDLCDAMAVANFLKSVQVDSVVLAAAKVGGILANNQFPVEFLSENLKIALNTIEASYEAGVKRLLNLGSTCIYPREASQPIGEDSLLSGPLETTNEAYALAKIVGLKLCQFYRRQYGVLFHSAMPTNLYGPGDNYHKENSHVLPGLLRRFHEAKLSSAPTVAIWGTGAPLREFLHVDDLADALLFLLTMENPPDWVNVGSGEEVSILELARRVARVVGFEGNIACDPSKPDGTPRKLANSHLLSTLGWRASISLDQGLASAYDAFLSELRANTVRLGVPNPTAISI
jgi:GDP-L-fucose synthase